MKIIGELDAKTYKLTVMIDTPPALFANAETHWLYITKIHAGGKIERRSIGIGMSDLDGLLQLLNCANADYCGPRKEFRVKSKEFEQRVVR